MIEPREHPDRADRGGADVHTPIVIDVDDAPELLLGEWPDLPPKPTGRPSLPYGFD